MSFHIVHLSDIHFGGEADLRQVQAVEDLVPDLDPRVIAVTGDLTQRSRHGEWQAARAFVRELERTAPVLVIPGNHDVQWWWRPFLPFAVHAKYRKYNEYFGPVLTPTLRIPEAVITSVLTSHGVTWGSLTFQPRDLGVKGHLPKKQIERAKELFAQAAPEQVRILLLHHNVLPGQSSRRMGLARWKQAERRIIESGADVILCGHDHQDSVEVLDGRVVVSCVGSLSRRSHGGQPSVLHRVTVEDDRIDVEQYRWESADALCRRSVVHTFPRLRKVHAAEVSADVG